METYQTIWNQRKLIKCSNDPRFIEERTQIQYGEVLLEIKGREEDTRTKTSNLRRKS